VLITYKGILDFILSWSFLSFRRLIPSLFLMFTLLKKKLISCNILFWILGCNSIQDRFRIRIRSVNLLLIL